MPEAIHTTTMKLSFLLDDFLDMLREKGFPVDVDDYVVMARLLMQYSNQELELEGLKYSVSAIICRSEEEQKRFLIVFDAYIQKKQQEINLEILEAQANSVALKKKKNAKIGTAVFVCLSAIVLFLLFAPVFKTDQYNPADFKILKKEHYTTDDTLDLKLFQQPEKDAKLHFATRQTYFQKLFFPRRDTVKVRADWDLGDTVIRNQAAIWYRFRKASQKQIKIRIANGKPLNDSITVCDVRPVITTPESIYINNPAVFTASGANGIPVIWKIDGKDTLTPGNALEHVFKIKGNHSISCRKKGQFCTHSYSDNSINVEVVNGESFDIENQQSEKFTPATVKKTSALFNTLFAVFLILAFVLLMPFIPMIRRYLVEMLSKKAEAGNNESSQYFSDTPPPVFSGEKLPIDIRFFKKDSLIKGKSNIRKWILDLQKKVATEDTKLNLPKTIHASVRNFGLFNPVYENKNKKHCYLFLIDVSYLKSPQIKLFSYLLNQLLANQIDLEVCYYYKNPLKVFKKNIDDALDIKRLKDDHYQSVLVIMSDGYNFLDANAPEIHQPFQSEFSYWPKRLLLTPTPSLDWSAKEMILARFFHIVPADSNGLLDIFPLLQQGTYNQKTVGTKNYQTYSAKSVIFEDVDELKTYFEDGALFQWLCMIAVYPKISWEMILALGATLDENIVTYENLLKISRINWIRDGSFPTRVRLELLKRLEIDNEVPARETIIRLLSEESEKEIEGSFAANEKIMQLIVNKFVLYSYDADKYAAYQKEEKEFLQLYDKQQIRDIPLRIYLEGNDPDKPGKIWKSIFGTTKDNLKNRFQEKINVDIPNNKIDTIVKCYRYLCYCCAGVMLSLGAVSYTKPNIPLLVNKENLIPKQWNLKLIKDQCFDKFDPEGFAILQGADTIYLEEPDTGQNKQLANDSIVINGFDKVYGKEVTFQFISAKGDTISQRFMIDGQRSIIKITGATCQPPIPDALNMANGAVYLQYFPGTFKDSILLFQKRLIDLKYKVPGVELRQTKNSEVRYYLTADKERADRLASEAASFFKQKIEARRLTELKGKNIEVWIVKQAKSDLPRLATCTSLKLSNNRYMIYYDYNNSNLSASGKSILGKALRQLTNNPSSIISVSGYCNAGTSLSYNTMLSDRIAKSVTNYLINNKIAKERITTKGKGLSRRGSEKCYGDVSVEIVIQQRSTPTSCAPAKQNNRYILYLNNGLSDIDDSSKAFLNKTVQEIKNLQIKNNYRVNVHYYDDKSRIFSTILMENISKYLNKARINIGTTSNDGTEGLNNFQNAKCFTRMEIELVDDKNSYENEYKEGPINIPSGSNYTVKGQFLYYGRYSDSKWSERYFNNSKDGLKFPEKGDLVKSLGDVNIREQIIQFTDKGVENQKIIGTLGKGTVIKVTNVIMVAGEKYIWVEFEKEDSPKNNPKVRNTMKK